LAAETNFFSFFSEFFFRAASAAEVDMHRISAVWQSFTCIGIKFNSSLDT
jgi:hypothetical protein